MQPDIPTNEVELGQSSLGRELRDGYEVHRAALARGLNVRLLPRQVMEVSTPEDSSRTVGFTHGVPESTTLAGATYAQDMRMRRAMLMKAGFAVPRGATFSVGRSKPLARRFASRIGYPVVIKPAVGDNTIEVSPNLQDRGDLMEAIEYLYTPPSQREKFTRAAYGLTELREPGRVNGKVVAPAGYRFLIEKHVRGQYLRFLIIDQRVANVLYCPDGPWESAPEQMRDVTGSTHQSLNDIAAGAARAVPGLAVAAVDIVVPNYEADTAIEDAQIVELSERPWLAVQHSYDPSLASGLADEILQSALPQAKARQYQEKISSQILIGGAVYPATLLDVLRQQFEKFAIESELYESDRALGQIRGEVQGTPNGISWVMGHLINKSINGQRAMIVTLQAPTTTMANSN